MGQETSCCAQNCKGAKNCRAGTVEKEPDHPTVVSEGATPEDVDLRFLMPTDLMLPRESRRNLSEKSTHSCDSLAPAAIPGASRASRQLPRTMTPDLSPTTSSQLPRTLTPDTAGGRPRLSRTLTPEVSRQLMRQDSKNLRGNAIGYFEVDTEIVRGISLRQTLRQANAIWLRPPATLPEEERAKLYERSRPVQHFDIFLSHTWSTDGKWKAFALLFRTGWPVMLLLNALSVCLTMMLCVTRLLPMTFDYKPPVVGFTGSSKLGGWLIAASLLGSVLGLALSPFLPSNSGNSCFLDVVSVHQSDQQLNERGIYGIGGFLAVSREMQVLWSKPYLSRLWCIFELAAYRTANPEGKITIAPLYVEQIVAVILICAYGMAATFVTARVLIQERFRVVVYGVAALPALVVVHMLRKVFQDRQQLVSDLHSFDLDAVRCQNDFDREFIHTAILKWYGSKDSFREFVQGPLREELVGKGSRIHLSGPYLALLVLVAMTPGLEFTLAIYGANAPLRSILANVVAGVLGFSVLWTIFSARVLLYFCDIAAKPIFSKHFDWLQSTLVFAIFGPIWSSGAAVATMSQLHSLEAAFGWLAFAAALTALSFTNLIECFRRCSLATVQQAPEPSELDEKV